MEYGEVKEIAVDEFYPSRWQRRGVFEFERMRDLMEDIDQHGVHDPVLYWVNEDGKKELLTGHRRCRASLALQRPMVSREYQVKEACMANFWTTFAPELRWQGHYKFSVPAREVTGPLDQLHALHARDNLQRADIDTLGIAEMVSDYITEHGATQLAAAQAFGKTQAWVSQMLSLVDLDPEVQQQVTSGKLSQSVAQIIAKLPDEETQRAVTAELLEAADGALITLSARAVQEVIREVQNAIAIGPEYWEIPPRQRVCPTVWNCTAQVRRYFVEQHGLGTANQRTANIAALYARMKVRSQDLQPTWDRRPSAVEGMAYRLTNERKWQYDCADCQWRDHCDAQARLLYRQYRYASHDCHLSPDAPFVVRLAEEMVPLLDCAECPNHFVIDKGYNTEHYCTDRECLIKMIARADEVWAAEVERQERETKLRQEQYMQEKLAELQAHHAEFQRLRAEADATEFPFVPRCEQCVNWDGTQCQFAVEPEFDRFSERLKLPSFVVYQNGTEDLFPACCDFEYANPANVPEVPNVAMPRELALRLLDELGGRMSIHADVLNAAHFAQLTVPQMVWLMQRSLHHINHDWQTGNTLVDYAGSEARQWKQQNWRDYWDSREN